MSLELQLQYTNYKNTLQQIAQKIGDVEQEAEEHKFVSRIWMRSSQELYLPWLTFGGSFQARS
jgi:hypothetical protein